MQGDGKNWKSGGEMSDPDKEVEKMSFWSPWSAVKALSEKTNWFKIVILSKERKPLQATDGFIRIVSQ